MDDSMAYPREGSFRAELPAWKNLAGVIAGVLLAILFLISGIWKITDPMRAATLMTQALVPHALSLPAALAFGIGETFAGVLLLVPRMRRWGAWLAGLMLVAFMAYFAIFYGQLRGEDCNCFPWVKRAVGPAFFISDAIMLLMAVLAGLWARRSEGLRNAAVILGSVAVFAFVSYGVAAVRQSAAQAPELITVDGKPFALREGRVFIYFFDPECSHCDQAARAMARYNWGETRLVAVATAQPQFAGQFLTSTQFKAGLSPDYELLRQTFPSISSPSALALEGGRLKALITNFEGQEPLPTLRRLGFVEP